MSEFIGIALTVLFVFFPKITSEGVKKGLEISVFSLVPSLFPYILISGIFQKSGASEVVSDVIYRFFKKILRFSKNGCGGFVLSLFCGYPSGAKISSELLKNNEISEKEAIRLFLVGNIPGFGFCVSFLNSKYKNGLKIYFSYIITALILNFVFSFFLKETKISPRTKKEEKNLFFKTVTDSITSASQTMLNLCGFVCFFSALSYVLGNFIKNKKLYALTNAFLEISSGAEQIEKIFQKDIALYTTVFFTGFCGLSVMMQSLSFSEIKINPKLLFLSRFIFALTSLCVFIFLKRI